MQRTEPRPRSLSPRGLAIAGWAAFAVFGALFFTLAWQVSGRAPVVQLDAAVSGWLGRHRTVALNEVMLVITHAHSMLALTTWTLVFALVLARLRERYWILTLFLAVGGGMALNWMLKVAYERARPVFDEPLVMLESYSFPSGHTAGATLFYGVLAAFLVSRYYDRSIRARVVAAAIVAVALVAFSRVYLGAHFLSDVVAAVGSSTAWLVLCLSGVHALVRSRMKAA